MAFQIRCPSCSKLYAAEERMMGKRMRCKACASVFTIEAPAEEPSLSAATMPGTDPFALSQSDLTGTRKQETPPSRHEAAPQSGDDDDEPQVSENPFLRPSIPQDFPMSKVVEAWLPLALGLIASVWVIGQTFSANETGQTWIPFLRIGIVAVLYLGLVLPFTAKVITVQFRKMKRILPPSHVVRTALTFAIPAAFGYEFWQASGGVGGYVTGLLMGIVLMAAVFWLLFRLTAEEAASTYAWAAGTFLATCGVAAMIVLGISSILNRSVVNEHAVNMFKESPLGAPLPWNLPSPETKPQPKTIGDGGTDPWANATGKPSLSGQPSQKTTEPSHPNIVAARDIPESNTQIATHSNGSEKVVTDPVVNPPTPAKPPEVFVNPDDDSFMDSIRKANLPWVKSVSRADGQVPFDFTISPPGQSRFVGLVDSADSPRMHVRLAPGSGALPDITDESPELQTFGARFMLTNDGGAILHIRGNHQLEMNATAENRHQIIPLEFPPSPKTPLVPTLVGVMRDNNVLVRWSAPQCQEQFLYRYDYLSSAKVSRMALKFPSTSPDVCAVSSNAKDIILYGWLSQSPARPPRLNMVNVSSTSTTVQTRSGDLPSDIMDVTAYDRGEMAFSPNGKAVAMVLEQGDNAKVMAWGTTSSTINPMLVHLTCKIPSKADMAGHVRGRSLQWINDTFFIVNGRTIISTRGGTIGNLTDQPVTGEQTTPDDKVYLSYMLPDGKSHLAAVELDPAALVKAPIDRSPSSH